MSSNTIAATPLNNKFNIVDTRRMPTSCNSTTAGFVPAPPPTAGTPNPPPGGSSSKRNTPPRRVPDSPSTIRRRISFEVQRSKSLLREDIYMVHQLVQAQVRKQEASLNRAKKMEPLPLDAHQKVWALKALVCEAEVFQSTVLQSEMLKMAVVGRAVKTLGAACPPDFYAKTKASTVILSDMDMIMKMPANSLPPCGAFEFARREVYNFPLWRPNVSSRC